jgi:hypothetical protein
MRYFHTYMKLPEVLKRRAFWLPVSILLAGAALRLVFQTDIEYKFDEDYMMQRVLHAGQEAWQWMGMPSGVHLRNPGMSVWVFLALGKLFSATDPVRLSLAVECLNIAALALLLIFISRNIPKAERESWYWGFALLAFNPIAVDYQRKIWAQSVLPFFCVLFLWAWWKRSSRTGAFFWGLLGPLMGQIHMSGFFFSAGFAAWTGIFSRKTVRWRYWLLSSAIATLPMLPWLKYALNPTTPHPASPGLFGLLETRYWVFWLTDPLGLHLGNILGVLRGPTLFQELEDFFRYPLLGGHPTYLMAAAHLGLVILGAVVLLAALYKNVFGQNRMRLFSPQGSETRLAEGAALWGYGILLTVCVVLIRRYYMIITFPLASTWLARQAMTAWGTKRSRVILGAIVILELGVSATFLGYIHVNGGATRGDYGATYQSQIKAQINAKLKAEIDRDGQKNGH